MRLLGPWLMIALVGCATATVASSRSATPSRDGSAPHAIDDDRRAAVIATATRTAAAWEVGIGDVVLDPALDCVASRLAGRLEVARYRTELPIVCGTPLYVVEARAVAVGELATTIAAMRTRFTTPVQVAVGTARAGDSVTVVIAARTIELTPFREGDRELRGTLLIDVHAEALVSSAAGVAMLPVTLQQRAFTIDVTTLDNADVELVEILEPDHRSGARAPLARFRLGTGSPLFARAGSVFERTNDARARLGLGAMRLAPGIGDCSGTMPARVADVEITDLAHCYSVPGISTDALASELAANPLSQLDVLGPKARVIEIGVRDGAASLRAFERFEELTATSAHARVLAALRARWPELPVHPAPPGALDSVLAKWADVTAVPAALTDELKAIAASWSPTPHYMSFLVAGRDLDVALARLDVNVTPSAVDLALAQVRGADGAMHHLVAVIFATP